MRICFSIICSTFGHNWLQNVEVIYIALVFLHEETRLVNKTMTSKVVAWCDVHCTLCSELFFCSSFYFANPRFVNWPWRTEPCRKVNSSLGIDLNYLENYLMEWIWMWENYLFISKASRITYGPDISQDKYISVIHLEIFSNII